LSFFFFFFFLIVFSSDSFSQPAPIPGWTPAVDSSHSLVV
jgi:hypothetical protein